ncbi:MAG: ADP-ribosylation factor-like protein, partial [Pseudomonadota bacterium]
DIAGDDKLATASTAYLRGASGFLLVADGTRRSTWENALNLHQTVTEHIGEQPFICLLNKADLSAQWELDEQLIAPQIAQGWQIMKSSAKTGEGVEEAFVKLAKNMLE